MRSLISCGSLTSVESQSQELHPRQKQQKSVFIIRIIGTTTTGAFLSRARCFDCPPAAVVGNGRCKEVYQGIVVVGRIEFLGGKLELFCYNHLLILQLERSQTYFGSIRFNCVNVRLLSQLSLPVVNPGQC